MYMFFFSKNKNFNNLRWSRTMTVIVLFVCLFFYSMTVSASSAPTLVDYDQSDYSNDPGGFPSTETTGTVTWQAGDLIVVVGGTENGSITLSTPSATGLSFNLVTSVNAGDSNNTLNYLWSATAASNGSSAVTSTCLQGMCGISVFVYRGSSGLGNYNTLSNSTNKVISLTRGSDKSAVVVSMWDWNAVNDTTVNSSPSGGTQRVAQWVNGKATAFVFDWGDQGTAGTQNYGITNHTGTVKMSGIVVEIKGGGLPQIKVRGKVKIRGGMGSAATQTDFLTYPSTSWSANTDGSNITVSCIGGGGGGAGGAGGNGGGGGEYRASNVAYTSGSSITYSIGTAGSAGPAGGAGGDGGDTTWNGSAIVAKGGKGGPGSGSTGGAGGTGGTGTTGNNGGAGGGRTQTGGAGGGGAGGKNGIGGAGGSTPTTTAGGSGGGGNGGGSAGANNSNDTGGNGGDNSSSSGHGVGGSGGTAGTNGTNGGGGGGGAGFNDVGGTPGDGGAGIEWDSTHGSGGGGGGGGHSGSGLTGKPGGGGALYGGGGGGGGNAATNGAGSAGANGICVVTYKNTPVAIKFR